jgi:hypothetical protein
MKIETLETKKQQALQAAAAAQEQVLKLEAEIKEATAKARKEAEEKRIAEQLESRSQAVKDLADFVPELQQQTKAMLASWEKAKALAAAAGVTFPERLGRLMLPVGFVGKAGNPAIVHSWMSPESEEHRAALAELGVAGQ